MREHRYSPLSPHSCTGHLPVDPPVEGMHGSRGRCEYSPPHACAGLGGTDCQPCPQGGECCACAAEPNRHTRSPLRSPLPQAGAAVGMPALRREYRVASGRTVEYRAASGRTVLLQERRRRAPALRPVRWRHDRADRPPGVSPSPGVDVGGVSPSPGVDVGGVSPSPGVDVAVVRAIMPSPVCADIRQTPQLITCTWRTIQRTTCSDSITAVPIVLCLRRKRTECEHTRSLRPRYYKLNRSRTFASPIVQCHISEACSGGAAVDDAQCAVGYTNNRWRPLRHAMFTPLRCRCSAQSAHLRLQPRVAALSTTRAQPSTRLSRNVQACVAHIMQQADCVEYPEYPTTTCLPVLR